MMSVALWIVGLSGQSGARETVIRGRTADSEIVIRANSRFGGAIYSLTWRGKEFIDAADHGRQLQSASNFDFGSEITSETFNPTEAGSRADGAGLTSSSRILRLVARKNVLVTTSQMAFWLAPSEKSGDNPAKNKTVLSNHILDKKVTIGYGGNLQRIRYEVTFRLPGDERHTKAVFESLTGYMPPEFSRFWRFWRFVAKTGRLAPLSDGPGEQEDPVILATQDGAYAMGIFSSESRPKGYGRWRFTAERVVKWNCVFRVSDPEPGASFAFKHDVFVGTLAQVEGWMRDLVRSHER